jgi:hypothetical protein
MSAAGNASVQTHTKGGGRQGNHSAIIRWLGAPTTGASAEHDFAGGTAPAELMVTQGRSAFNQLLLGIHSCDSA